MLSIHYICITNIWKALNSYIYLYITYRNPIEMSIKYCSNSQLWNIKHTVVKPIKSFPQSQHNKIWNVSYLL